MNDSWYRLTRNEIGLLYEHSHDDLLFGVHVQMRWNFHQFQSLHRRVSRFGTNRALKPTRFFIKGSKRCTQCAGHFISNCFESWRYNTALLSGRIKSKVQRFCSTKKIGAWSDSYSEASENWIVRPRKLWNCVEIIRRRLTSFVILEVMKKHCGILFLNEEKSWRK